MMAFDKGIRLETPAAMKGFKATGQGGWLDLEARRGWLSIRWAKPGSGSWDWQLLCYDLDTRQQLYRLDGHEYGSWVHWHAATERLLAGFVVMAWIWERPEQPGLRLDQQTCPAFTEQTRWRQGLLGPIQGLRDGPDERDTLVHFDPGSLQRLAEWELPMRVFRLAASPEGRLAISSRRGKSWQVGWGPTPDAIALRDAPGKEIFSLAWLPDERHLALGRADGKLEIWDTLSGAVISSLSHAGAVRRIVSNADGSRLYTAANDKLLRAWDLGSGKLLQEWKGHTDFITDLALDEAVGRLYSAACDRSIRWWDIES